MSEEPMSVSGTIAPAGKSERRPWATWDSVVLFVASVIGLVVGMLNLPPGKDAYATLGGTRSSPVSFDLIDNRIFVKVYLDGKGPFNFIFDTGADAVVTPQVASILGVQVTADGVTSGVGAQSVTTGQATIRETRIGVYSIQNHKYAVLPIDGTREVFGTVPVDGIIGLPYFERYAVTVDYANRQLTFVPTPEFHYHGSGHSVPFVRLDSIPTVLATLDGVSGEFDVDTGARSSLILFAPFIGRFNLRTKYAAQIEGITGWGLGGPVRSQLARAKQLRIGDIVITGPIIRLTTQKTGLTATLQKAGLIGPGILRQFNVIFDYAHERMILERNAFYGSKDSYDKTGLWLGQDGTHFKVLDVITSSPASDQGFQIGDEVLSIDGIPSERLLLPSVRTCLQAKPAGTVVHIMVRNIHGVSQKTLILRDLV